MNSPESSSESLFCSRCGAAIDPEDCFHIVEVGSERVSFICRVEHVAAWAMRQPGWSDDPDAAHGMLLRRHRSGTTTEYSFETLAALRKWALAGGEWSGGN
ncbi:MAG: hypothetical protein ACRDKI_09045 [Solirubrobacterales bacterium]